MRLVANNSLFDSDSDSDSDFDSDFVLDLKVLFRTMRKWVSASADTDVIDLIRDGFSDPVRICVSICGGVSACSAVGPAK